MSCPSFHDLLAWKAQDSESPSDDSPARHVEQGCPHCLSRLKLLDVLAASLGSPAPPVVSPALMQRTLNALAQADAAAAPAPARREPGSVARILSQLQEFVGQLLDPKAMPTLAVGLRGQDDDSPQRYVAGPYVLDVGLVGRAAVLGQITDTSDDEAREFAGATAVLCGSDGLHQAVLDDDAGFRFADAGPGRYALMIEASGLRLMFPDVDLASAGR